ncbi:enoyl-CoA hydratase/isomerase family protein [Sphingomonas jatrophae]|nr:enoyl-CoA hydratase/isomerase family protein [Sphingomonas jatrophae]
MFTWQAAGGIARIVIDRPAARNAVTLAGWAELGRVVAQVAAERPAAVILHARSGPAFCAGADLDELARLAEDREGRAVFHRAMADAFAALAALPMPTVAAIDGPCHGAGVALAMACDLRLAGTAARFSIPPARLGILYPPADVARLTALVGRAHAIRLLATGATIDAEEAARIGLVDMIAPDPLREAEAMAGAIAANDWESVNKLKHMVDGAEESFEDGLGSPAFAVWAKARIAR